MWLEKEELTDIAEHKKQSLNRCIQVIPAQTYPNRLPYVVLAFIDNDKGVLNDNARPVALYQEQWYNLAFTKELLYLPYLGTSRPDIHDYDTPPEHAPSPEFTYISPRSSAGSFKSSNKGNDLDEEPEQAGQPDDEPDSEDEETHPDPIDVEIQNTPISRSSSQGIPPPYSRTYTPQPAPSTQ